MRFKKYTDTCLTAHFLTILAFHEVRKVKLSSFQGVNGNFVPASRERTSVLNFFNNANTNLRDAPTDSDGTNCKNCVENSRSFISHKSGHFAELKFQCPWKWTWIHCLQGVAPITWIWIMGPFHPAFTWVRTYEMQSVCCYKFCTANLLGVGSWKQRDWWIYDNTDHL